MPTEVVTETVRPSTAGKVMAVDRSETRQDLSKKEQILPPAKESGQASSQQLQDAAENMNKHVQSLKRDLYFSVDEDTGETVIKVVDSESQKTIRTIPSEEFVSVSQQLNNTVGLLLNARV